MARMNCANVLPPFDLWQILFTMQHATEVVCESMDVPPGIARGGPNGGHISPSVRQSQLPTAISSHCVFLRLAIIGRTDGRTKRGMAL